MLSTTQIKLKKRLQSERYFDKHYNMIRIHLIAAARPNFMKIAPLYHTLIKEDWANPVIVHTGQHYDINMSDIFFKDLNLPEPDIHLGVGSGTHAEQTGKVMIAYEKVVLEKQPDLVIVVGDVNSTVACTLAAVKLQTQSNPINQTNFHSIKFLKNSEADLTGATNALNTLNFDRSPVVGHLEAGLRSFDRSMPEEINRLLTDAVADILWTPSPDGDENLIQEGVAEEKIKRVGNIMIDSLEMVRNKIESESVYKELNLEENNFSVVTLHRPSNVDDPRVLKRLCQTMVRLSEKLPMVFPVHPRTKKNIDKAGLNYDLSKASYLNLLEPISYRKFMSLVFNCRLVITDSGGIQEETSYLGIPCLTLRPNTERPITVTEGTNQLITVEDLEEKVNQILSSPKLKPAKIDLWDGHTAVRVVQSIKEYFNIR